MYVLLYVCLILCVYVIVCVSDTVCVCYCMCVSYFVCMLLTLRLPAWVAILALHLFSWKIKIRRSLTGMNRVAMAPRNLETMHNLAKEKEGHGRLWQVNESSV